MSDHMIADQPGGQVWEMHPGLSLAENQRIYAIGDTHGRADLLQQLISTIRDDISRSLATDVTVIFLGDYLDRGPDSAEVIDILLSDPVPEAACVFLRGNHEQYLIDFVRDGSRFSNWLLNGGTETFLSYGIDLNMHDCDDEDAIINVLRRAMPPAHIEFLNELPFCHRSGSLFFAHAGVNPDIPLDEQRPIDLIWIRDRFLHSGQDLGVVVVHGHTPVDEPDILSTRINMDTMAYASGHLSALVAENQRYRIIST